MHVHPLLVDRGARLVRRSPVRISWVVDVARLDPGEVVAGVGFADECVWHVLDRRRARNVVQAGQGAAYVVDRQVVFGDLLRNSPGDGVSGHVLFGGVAHVLGERLEVVDDR